MADKSARRGITVFIDGQEVVNKVKDISQEMRKLQNEQSRMTIGSDEYVKHGKKIAEMQSIINEHKDNLKDLASQYANNTKGVDGFINRMAQLPGILGYVGRSLTGVGDSAEMLGKNKLMLVLSGITLLASGFMALVKHSMAFAKASSELSALTGATGADLDYLKNKAIDLAKEYGKSAVEIVTAMKLVGSAKPELLSNVGALADVTKSVLTLSKATGMELSDSTKNVTTIMNQFGLSALESDRTINTLAAGSKYGAVEVDYLGESISKVGTISKSAGLSLEQTTAVMELFGEKGVKAETAGTGFKGVLVKLQADTKNYTNGVFDLNKAIDNNQKISGDNMALQKKFGTEFFGLAQILLQNKNRFQELTTQVTGTDTAMEQMLIATDNLSGDVDKMSSSWDSFLLGLENGKGPLANASRWIVQLGKDALDTLSKLTKSGNEKDKDSITKSVEDRINVTKKQLETEKDKMQYIESLMSSERNIYAKYNKEIKRLQDERTANNKKNFFMHSTSLEAQNKKDIESLQRRVNKSVAYVNALAGLKKQYNLVPKDDDKKPTGSNTGSSGATPDKSKKKDPYKDDLKALEDFWKDDEAINKNAYAKGAIGEDVYHEFMYDNQIGFLEDKIKLQKKYGQDTTETQIAISEAILAENEYWNNKEKAQDKDLLASKKQDVKTRVELAKEIADIMERYGVDEAGRLKTQKDLELKIVEEAYKQGIISATIYAETIKKINAKSLPEWANKTKEIAGGIANVAGEFSSALQGFQSAEERSIETKYQKQIDAAQKAGKDTTAIEEKKNKELAAIRAENADSALAIQVAMIAASTAEAAISAYASAVKVPIVGPVLAPIAAGAAVAYGLSQVAQAKAARDAAKEGYYDGGYHKPEGYTGGTDPREVRGVFPDGQPYHGDEFIANHKTTRNREVRPVLDLIDSAQRLGTASSLTRADISKALRLSPGYSDGGYRGSNTPVSPNYNDGGDTMSMAEIAAAINRLNDRLDKGIVAESVISGKTGSFEQTKKYEKLIKNASR